ncbi:MAG: hypothetical protein NT042_08370 [Sulfuritalea sp.]|nr:hypothetical protein [Sulfuritalea sp.]
MKTTLPGNSLQLQSLIKQNGELELSLVSVRTPEPGANQVLVRMEAAPMNPSDLGLLFGAADISTAKQSGDAQRPVVTARVPAGALKAMAARMDMPMPVGNEGAGLVVAAGPDANAQALIGKRVALLGGAMFSQYRCMAADQCLPLPADATSADGASCFVNPLTALGMVETMRREGHSALVHTAAASNLGQMLNRICLKDGIALVNIDAIGGGRLPGQILSCMEMAINRSAKEYSRYGSATHKQVYLYGMLDTSPTEIVRNFGMSWGMGGWLLFPFLQKLGPSGAQALKERVAAELKTTFKSHYSKEVSMAEALQLDAIAVYGKRATGEKFLINPSLDAVAD